MTLKSFRKDSCSEIFGETKFQSVCLSATFGVGSLHKFISLNKKGGGGGVRENGLFIFVPKSGPSLSARGTLAPEKSNPVSPEQPFSRA